MKKLLLLGSTGQLGTAINEEFKSNSEFEIVSLVRSDFDAETDSVLEKLSQYKSVDYFVNCIAYHKTDECESNEEKSMLLNATYPQKLAQFCSSNKITLVHFSTDYVFNGTSSAPYNESDNTSPINVYGKSKLEGERLIAVATGNYFIFRVASLFGNKRDKSTNYNFVLKMLSAYKNKKQLSVIDNQFMSPTYTRDVAKALMAVFESGSTEYGLYHATNSGSCSWHQFAVKIFEQMNIEIEIRKVSYDSFHTIAKRPQFVSLNNSKLCKIYEIPKWEDSLKEYIETYININEKEGIK